MTLKRWRLVLAFAAVLPPTALAVWSPSRLWMAAWLDDDPADEPLPPGVVDDASRLNPTPVAEVWSIPSRPEDAEAQLRELLARARRDGLGVSISGARHSMGGHAITEGGVVLDMLPFDHLELDEEGRILEVGAGARWSQVIPFLDARGRSIEVMQSNNDFTVGGSLAVNCHGWQQDRPPIASTVQSLRVMTADGSIIVCDREHDRELFSLVLGGYGLFGVILEARIRVVPNARYRSDSEVLAADRFAARFSAVVADGRDVGLAYGRLCVVPGEATFLREAILTVFREAPCSPAEMPSLGPDRFDPLRREVYRAQIGSAVGKSIRWKTEKRLGEQLTAGFVSRNHLLNEGAEVYRERNHDRTDILHEYFVPPSRFGDFLDRARAIVPRHDVDLLNVTVRHVLADPDTVLRYADQEMFALVMLFNQPRTSEADDVMKATTRELVDAALDCGGRHYLPYRLHASREQFDRAYPSAKAFFERKRALDPDGIFRNGFLAEYGGN